MYYGKYEKCGYCRYCICDNARMDIINGKFRCDRERTFVFADQLPLKNNCFWQIPSYNLSDRDEAIKLSKLYRGFYITTMIFEKLNIKDATDLNRLYAFRHNYLTIARSEFLSDYDVFAPKIAKLISLTDTNSIKTKVLYQFYIKGVLDLIKREDFEGASELYIAMYDKLKSEYIYEPLKKTFIKNGSKALNF